MIESSSERPAEDFTPCFYQIRRSFVRKNFVPGGIRTPNLLIRSQKLYPVELQALALF